jgi:hypothetical protein
VPIHVNDQKAITNIRKEKSGSETTEWKNPKARSQQWV